MDKSNGYKAFYNNMTNNFGQYFEEGKIYVLPDQIPLKPGVGAKGFHYTPYLEDTLRYVDGRQNPIKIAQVSSLGQRVEFDDEFFGYYDIQNTRILKINHVLSRDEILQTMLKRPSISVSRFIAGYSLTEEEVDKILDKYYSNINIINYLLYYQYNETRAFYSTNNIEERFHQLKKVRQASQERRTR